MTAIPYPGFRRNEPTATGRSIVTAADAVTVRTVIGVYSEAEVDAAIASIDTSGLVPYTGANQAVNLGSQSLACGNVNVANLSAVSIDGGSSPTLQNLGGYTTIRNVSGGNGIQFTNFDDFNTGESSKWVRIPRANPRIASNIPVRFGLYTFATVPTASSYTGYQITISDRDYRSAYSDGTNWRFISDDAIIS